jgi:hypothetical protein
MSTPAKVTTSPTTPTRAPAVLAPMIAHELQQGAAHYRAAGVLLLEAKDALPHGAFTPWIAEHFTVTLRSAQNYMRLAKTKTSSSFEPYGGTTMILGCIRSEEGDRLRCMDALGRTDEMPPFEMGPGGAPS